MRATARAALGLAGVSLLAASLTPARAQDPGPPLLVSGNVVVTSTGTAAAALLVPEPFELTPGADGITLRSSTWAALALVYQPDPRTAPGRPYLVGHLQLPAPAGCSSGPAPRCADARGLVLTSYFEQSRVGGGGFAGRAPKTVLRYPAGRYVAYLFTAPGHRVQMTWHRTRSRAITRAEAELPVRYQFSADRREGLSQASVAGTVSQRFTRVGAFIDSTWAADVPDAQDEADSQHLCIRRQTSSSPPLDESSRCWLAIADPGGASVVTGPTATGGVLVANSTSGLSVAGRDENRVGVGTYLTTFDVRTVGQRPSAGTAMLNWEYVY